MTGTISVKNTAAQRADANNSNKKVIHKNCALSTDCISEISNTQGDNAKGIDTVIAMYNLLKEYNNNYLKTSGSLWQYYRDAGLILVVVRNVLRAEKKLTIPLLKQWFNWSIKVLK